MAYLSNEELKKIGFKSIGENVKISNKASIYNPELISIGKNSRIDDFCVISGKITIGRNVHIAPHCLVAGGEEGITLEDFSGLAYYVQIFSQSDDYSGETLTNPTIDKIYKKEIKKSIHIGRHVIIGAGAVVFPGVTIKEGCAIGSLSLVKRSTEAWTIYAGNPAKKIKNRKQDLLALEKTLIGREK